MALSPDAVKAYEEFESALANLMKHHPRTRLGDNHIVSGWVVIVESVAYGLSEDETGNYDEVDPQTSNYTYSRRGQSPTLSRGLVEQYRDWIGTFSDDD